MSIALDFFLDVPFMVIFAAVLSVATVVDGFGWTISARAVCIDIYFWKFSKILPITLQWMMS